MLRIANPLQVGLIPTDTSIKYVSPYLGTLTLIYVLATHVMFITEKGMIYCVSRTAHDLKYLRRCIK